MSFQEKLDKAIEKNKSFVCVGLDSDLDKIPEKFKKTKHPQFEFNKWIIDQTHDLVCAYKPNSAFYEAEGLKGILSLKLTCHYLKKNYPHIPTILDAKRGDIGSTNKGYVKYAFDFLKADAITLHPYLGQEALAPFLERKDKGCFILCKTSNPGAKEFQDLIIIQDKNYFSNDRYQSSKESRSWGISMYQYIATHVVKKWNQNGNCMLIVGATYPRELREVRKIVGDITLLVPGIGAQDGNVEETVESGLNSKEAGLIINSSRSIIFSRYPRKEAQKLRDEVNRYRK